MVDDDDDDETVMMVMPSCVTTCARHLSKVGDGRLTLIRMVTSTV